MRRLPDITLNCPTCKHDFVRRQAYLNCTPNARARFCSQGCANRSRDQRTGAAKTVRPRCGYCGKRWRVNAYQYKRRKRQSADLGGSGRLYCSKSCAGFVTGNGFAFKRAPGLTDLQWEWEKKLHDLGLGVFEGSSSFLVYGHEEETPKDQY